MARKTVAVYDGSEGYINQFLEYLSRKKDLWFEAKGFNDTNALEDYLADHKVDILLFSMEELVEEEGNPEIRYEKFISHENVKEFIYFGERRNSKSRIKHISKYQSVERILSELKEILFSKEERQRMEQEEETEERAELVCIYTPAPATSLAPATLKIAEVLAPEIRTLFLDLDHFSVIPFLTGVVYEGGLSDLIYLYKTNPQKIKTHLQVAKKSFNGVDILSMSSELEDVDEIEEKEWPAFIRCLAKAGGYESVVVNMAEAFRRPEVLMGSADVVYLPLVPEDLSTYKVSCFAKYLMDKGCQDIFDKIRLLSAKCKEEEGVIEGEIGWIW